ncbi:hypothetical protein VE25_07325 [Devosia geojensis]|uniref:Uncharacterized protein n=1 Tax=Devosia geojensis TaxID=443610 RepID=A0A0F5FUV9_9HYPH|nr:hypothetical protein [Devosia geojensis]KKB12360.1 hypothetical protein VE25_07325 [Devosia geojensis]
MPVVNEGGHIVLRRSGRKIFGTDVPPVSLFPAQQIVTTRTVAFPDFPKDFIYGFVRFSEANPDPFGGPVQAGYCLTLVKIIPSELADTPIVIGTVPAGCNYIDVRAALTWSKQPDLSAGSPVRSPTEAYAPNQVHLQGGSCVLEIGSGFRRAIHVGLSGTNVLLTRMQSSRSEQPVPYSPWGGPTQTGWSYGTSPLGMIQGQIDAQRVFSFQGQPFVPPHRGSSTACSTTINSDHSSIWSIQFIITPGRYNTAL